MNLAMEWLSNSVNFATYCENISTVVLIIGICKTKLLHRYWGSAVFTSIELIVGISALICGVESSVYYTVYMFSTAIQTAALGIIAWQVFSPINNRFPGFRILARKTLIRAVCFSIGIGAIAIPATIVKWNNQSFSCPAFKLFELHRFLATVIFIYVVWMYKHLRRYKLDTSNTSLVVLWLCAYLPTEVIGDITIYFFHGADGPYYIASLLLTVVPAAANVTVGLRLKPEPHQELAPTECDSDIHNQVRAIGAFIADELKRPAYSVLILSIMKALKFGKD